MIPKSIVTYWLTETPTYKLTYMSELIKKCIDSQKIEGYTHRVITLDDCDRSSEYVRQALENKNWVKATDYLRIQYLYKYGGIHLDADMEVLPGKNFDDLLDCRMFTSFECAGLYAQAGFGAEAGHPILKQYLDRVDNNYKGSGDLVFEPGIRTWHDICWAADKSQFKMIPTEVFFPYDHLTGKTNVTDETRVFHHYNNSWVTPLFKGNNTLSKEMEEAIEKYRQSKEDGTLDEKFPVIGTVNTIEQQNNASI